MLSNYSDIIFFDHLTKVIQFPYIMPSIHICTSNALVTVFGRNGLFGLTFRAANAAHSASNGSLPVPVDDGFVVPPIKLTVVLPPVPFEVVQDELIGSLALLEDTWEPTLGAAPRDDDLN